MKRWIKRTLVAVFGVAALFGGLAAWAQHRHHAWQNMTEQDRIAMQARMVDRVAGRLDLDAAQKAKLATLGDTLRAQRSAFVGNATDPRAELQGLIAGNTFDRTAATRLVEAKTQAVASGSPAVITALGDFYDSLRPDQQAKVRTFLQRRGPGHHDESRG